MLTELLEVFFVLGIFMRKKMPLSIIDLDLTNNCVLACDYCFRGAKNPRRITLETAKAAIDWFIAESGDNKKLSVALFGGEPLMEFELIKKLVPYAVKQCREVGKDIHFSATTNCVLINDEMIEFFRKYKMNFHTSIDGGPESHDKHRVFPNGKGSSAIIEPKIRKVLEIWPHRTARMSVSNDTVCRWMEDVQYLVELGYKKLAMIPIPELDWTEEQFKVMQQQLREISDYYIERYRQGNPVYIKHIDSPIEGIIKPKRKRPHCGAGRDYALVKTDGSIYPCHRFGGDIDAGSQQKWKLGSIFDGWLGAKRQELLDFDCRKDIKADCENCIAVHTCTNTCIAVGWASFKDIYKPHPNQCRFTKLFFTEAMRVHYILESENNRGFIKKYYPQRLKKYNAHGRNADSKGKRKLPDAVFVMLSSSALSPCFMFNGDTHGNETLLSMDNMKSVLKWSMDAGDSMTNLFFLASEIVKLDISVSKFLESFPEQIMLPLVSSQRQKELQIPFSEKQIVIASSLKKLIAEQGSISSRPVIAHVDRSEIEQIADLLLSIKDRIPQITLRLRNAHELNDNQIAMYKKQLSTLKGVVELKGMLNLDGISSIHTNEANGKFQCPAGRQLVTIGPDGLAYPCPTFYRNGLEGRSLDSINVSADEFSIMDTQPGCLCDSDKCPGCEFLKTSGYENGKQICNVYKAELV